MQPKRRRLVAETADDLQQILFGELEENEAPEGSSLTNEQQQAILPAGTAEAEDVEVFSDSDKDSMDDFIVRDLNEEREHRFVSDYSGKYGDDVAEGLNDVVAIFGDLRILDIYTQGDLPKVRRVIEKDMSIEERFDPEEVEAQLASTRDEVILSTDAPERFQEESGTEHLLETLECFEAGIDSEKLETEWSAESVWLYSVLTQQYRQRSKRDWTIWSPTKMDDKEAVRPGGGEEDNYWWYNSDMQEKATSRFRVFLRDFKGRGLDPITIWSSMACAKYCTCFSLLDLQNAQLMDSEWNKLWRKKHNIEAKLLSLLAEVEGYLAAMAAIPTNDDQTDLDPDSIVSKPVSSVNQLLAETAKTDLANLLAELRFVCSPEGIGAEFSETLDDISASLNSEIEPVVRYVAESSLTGSPTKSSSKKATSIVAQLISNQLHETLLPLLSLSPREIGDNLSMGAKMNKGPFAGMVPPSIEEESITPSLKTAAIEFLTSTISSNIRIRRWFRNELRAKAAVFTHPIGPVSSTKRLYRVRRLAGRPVSELFGTSVMTAITSLVDLGEISMDMAIIDNGKLVLECATEVPDSVLRRVEGKDQMAQEDEYEMVVKNASSLKAYMEQEGYGSTVSGSDVVREDPLLSDLLGYMAPEIRNESSWLKAMRLQVARGVVAKLYKLLKAELLTSVSRDNHSVAARNAATEFGNLLKMRHFDARSMVSRSLESICDECRQDNVIREAVRRRMGFFSVMSVVIEKVTNGYRTHVVVVGHRGDIVDTSSFDALLTPNSDLKQKDADKTRIGSIILKHLVSMIVIGADDRKARGAQIEFQSIVKDKLSWEDEAWNYLKWPEVYFGDLAVPTRVAKQAESGEQSLSVLTAASLGRYQQSPTAEILSLWSDVHSSSRNPALTIPVDDLQSFVPKPVLEREYLLVASRIVAENGVDLNDSILSVSRRSLLKFVPGLGPRKARLLIERADAHLRGLDSASGSTDHSRTHRLEELLGKRVFRNAQPFLKLTPDCDKVALYVVENGLRVDARRPRRRRYSSDSGSSSDNGSSDSSSTSSDSEDDDESMHEQSTYRSSSEYFGIPNRIVRSLLEGFNYMELCRMGRDCWSAASRLYTLSMEDSGKSGSTSTLFLNMGDKDVADIVHRFNPTSLIDDMYADSSNVPSHLADPGIELDDLKEGTGRVFGSVIIPQLGKPFVVPDNTRTDWHGPTKIRLFYAMVKESESELNLWTVSTFTVSEVSDKGWLKLIDSATGLSGWLNKSRNDSTRYREGDSVTCRVSDIDFAKLGLTLTTDPITKDKIEWFTSSNPNFVRLDSDFDHLVNLGKIEVVAKSVVKSRRIIKHESFFEISHGAGVEKLLDMPIGEVIFRPSTSQPGIYFGLIKIAQPCGDPTKEDWIKVVRFAEGPSARSGKTGSKTVFKILDAVADEFEEFDQMKVVFVDKYMRFLSDIKAHPKFRPEHPDQVRNMLLAKMRTGTQSAVAYSLVMDHRRECAGNALLLWAGDRYKVHDDIIEITHRGFKWWSRGPFPSVNSLLTWWKQGGYRERAQRMKEWQDEQAKKSIVS